ncbi:embryo sac development arrest protein [Trifolium repens]|nr:embryo sac development arrest protein [Trifolium repens]
MNTKTMRLPPRRVLTPSSSSTTSNKRKERDDPFERPKPIHGPNSKLLKPDKPISKLGDSEPVQSTKTTTTPSNQLLAGYLAHEFLTKGTLMGKPWLPSSRGKEEEDDDDDVGGEEGEATEAPPCRRPETKIDKERYVEVTALLKSGGTHLPGVVNPTQLARFLDL